MEFPGKGILLDVEGTTSAVAYVYDVMFPFARTGLASYLDQHWDSPAMTDVRAQVAGDTGMPAAASDRAVFESEIVRLMDSDVKATGLKQLQGLIWEAGFNSGELVAHVFDDVPPALHRWQQAGIDLRIYSSGSVPRAAVVFRSHYRRRPAAPLLGPLRHEDRRQTRSGQLHQHCRRLGPRTRRHFVLERRGRRTRRRPPGRHANRLVLTARECGGRRC